jgi:serine/threonine protein kinase
MAKNQAKLVLSYSHDNAPFIKRLVHALEKRNVEVWRDSNLQLDVVDYSREIRQQIIAATAVLVVWSKSACNSRWVSAEADLADTHNKLIQVISENCDLPLPFGRKQFGDLTSWRGGSSDDEINKIVDEVNRLMTQKEREAPDADADEQVVEDRNEAQKILETDVRIKVSRFLQKGETSKAYLGQAGTRLVLVKVITGIDLSANDKEALSKEAELAAYLHDQTFLRIAAIVHRNRRCVIITDFYNGETIERKLNQGITFSISEVTAILNQLCRAVAEAHARSLRHLRIAPSEIFVYEESTLTRYEERTIARQVAQISPINFTYFLERCRAEHSADWRDATGPYMAPELWDNPAWFKNCIESEIEGQANASPVFDKAYQFALGMTAWTMLEGRLPYDIPQSHSAYAKICDFLETSKNFSVRLREAKGRGEARALYSIVARMVEFNSKDRWADLKQVGRLVAALAANDAAKHLDPVVKALYQKVCEGKPDFYRCFYDSLFRRCEHLRGKFPSDLTRQYEMLDTALGQLFNYGQNQSEPTTLTQFVKTHVQLRLSADDFTHFGEALIETFDCHLQGVEESQRILAAIEITIWPGIYYLMKHCAVENTEHLVSSEKRNGAQKRARTRRLHNTGALGSGAKG